MGHVPVNLAHAAKCSLGASTLADKSITEQKTAMLENSAEFTKRVDTVASIAETDDRFIEHNILEQSDTHNATNLQEDIVVTNYE